MKANENMNTFMIPWPCTNSDMPLSSTALQRPRQELGDDEYLKDLSQVHKTGNNKRLTNKDMYVLQVLFFKTINDLLSA